MIKINDTFSIIKGSRNPLSCDTCIIKGKQNSYVIEAGNNPAFIDEINKLDNIVLIITHFHVDHLGNFNKINYKRLLIGDFVYKYTKDGEVINDELIIEDGVKLRIFSLRSSHAKGSLGIEIGDYVFLGDGCSPTIKGDERFYNAQLLQEEIKQLENLNGKYFVFSHNMDSYELKEDVINRLKEIYSKREKNNPYIIVGK